MMFGLNAQVEYSIQSLRNVYQASDYNPAYRSTYSLSLGLPGISSIYGAVGNTGFNFSDVITEELINGSHRLDVDRLAGNISRKKNYLFAGAQVNLFHIQFQEKNNFWSFHSKVRTDTRFSYPKDLFVLAADGNLGAGNQIDLSGLAFDQMSYIENALGYNKKVGDWVYGFKLKYLMGLTNIRTRKSDLTWDINQDDIYQYKFSGNYEVLTAGIPTIDTAGNTNEFDETWAKPQGNGLAIDIGASYQIIPKLLLSASINDVGFIRWKKHTSSYKAQEDFEYDGIVVTIQSLEKGEISGPDTIDYNYEYTQGEKYTTSVRANLNLSARYQLLKRLWADAVINISAYRGLRPGGSVGLYWEWKRFLNVSLSNTMSYGRMLNPALGLVIKPGPLQFYIVTDNMATLFAPLMVPKGLSAPLINPYKSKSFGIHVGMNLVFGRVKDQETLQSIVK